MFVLVHVYYKNEWPILCSYINIQGVIYAVSKRVYYNHVFCDVNIHVLFCDMSIHVCIDIMFIIECRKRKEPSWRHKEQ